MSDNPRDGERSPVRLYAKPDGQIPFAKWLESLKDVPGRALIRARIRRVQLGNLGDCRQIGEALAEMRIHFGPGYRVYFGQDREELVLLWGGMKRTQQRDVERAKAFWQDYRRRSDA